MQYEHILNRNADISLRQNDCFKSVLGTKESRTIKVIYIFLMMVWASSGFLGLLYVGIEMFLN